MITHEELITSKEYILTDIQIKLFNAIENYMRENNLNRTQLAQKLNVTKGYVTQILNGDFDHKISKLVELYLAIDKIPILKTEDKVKYVTRLNEVKSSKQCFSEWSYTYISEQTESFKGLIKSQGAIYIGKMVTPSSKYPITTKSLVNEPEQEYSLMKKYTYAGSNKI